MKFETMDSWPLSNCWLCCYCSRAENSGMISDLIQLWLLVYLSGKQMKPVVCMCGGILEGNVTEGAYHKLPHNSNKTFQTVSLGQCCQLSKAGHGNTTRWPQEDISPEEFPTWPCPFSGSGHCLNDLSPLQVLVELLLVALLLLQTGYLGIPRTFVWATASWRVNSTSTPL